MIYIGVDLSDKFFDSCITNSSGDVLNRNRFDFDHDGFCSFIKLISEYLSKVSDCVIGLENPRSSLVDFLIQRGYNVLFTNPNAIFSYRKSRANSNSKSDEADAQLIADYVRENHKRLKSIQMSDEAIRELSLLLEDRDKLVKQKVLFSNQLTSTLKEFFPQVLKAFGRIDNKSTIQFLKRIDTFDQLKALSAKQREQLLIDCGINREKSKEKFYGAMKKSVYHTPPSVVKTKVRLKNVLVDHLDLLIGQIQEYESQIRNLMDDSDHGDIFRSLPGADYILGAKILVIFSTRDFSDASEAQQLFGTAPYTSMSGQSRIVGFRIGANKFGRNTFQQLARCSIRASNWAKKQYAKKRNEGKGSQHAFRCIANTWVKITFALWRNKTPYDESRHLASIANHLMNQSAFVNGD